uniref:RNA helicase n=1 Tax=Oryzias latipes TaxID=8090 RepID=H2MMA0_ORYLA
IIFYRSYHNLIYRYSPFHQIVLMSATINCREFAEYFSTPVCGRMIPAYVFEVEGAPYTIEEFYLDDLHKLFPCRMKFPQSDFPCIPEEMYSVAISLIQSFDDMEDKDSREKEDGKGVAEKGSVLVFLPGINEISSMQEALGKLIQKRLQVFPLHSSVTLEEQNNVFLTPIPGCRKVNKQKHYLSRWSSFTDQFCHLIDFCLVRQMVCDPDTNYQSLRLTWAAKTNCNQRKGRAGRVSKGYCYRLVTKAFWKTEIPEYMTPEMLLAPLSSIMLKVKLLDIGDPCSLLSTALSPPSVDNIVRTVLQLKEIGALSVRSDGRDQNYDGELTFLGRVLAHLPVDLRLGKMIVLGHVFGCLDECLIIGQSSRNLPSFRLRRLFNCVQLLFYFFLNFIQIKSIREVAELYEELKTRVSQFNMHVTEDTQLPDYTSIHKQRFILQVAIAGAYYPNYFVQMEMDEQMATKDMCGLNPQTTVMLRRLPPYSFLYYKQLLSVFRLCGQVKTVHFENTRVFVEFSNASSNSEVLSEVSLALLLARQGSPMEISVYPTGQIEAFTGDRSISHLKYGRYDFYYQTDLSSSRSVHYHKEDLYLNSRFFYNPKFLFCLQVVDVGHFWGYPSDEESMTKQQKLTTEINSRTLNPVTVALHPNMCVLAPYAENAEQSLYYRAKILHISANVFFVDFGNKAVVASKNLREIPSDLLSHPFQGMEFQLAGMSPSAKSIILGNKWSSQARNDFSSLIKGQLVMVSVYSILHGVIHVDMLINTQSKEISMVDILVENGHAVKTEESYDSKVKGSRCSSPGSSLTFLPEETFKTYFLYIIKIVVNYVLILKICSSFFGILGAIAGTTELLQSKILPFETVSIDKSSINSIALNESPHLKHMRMLVAGTVSVNASGSCILLKDTSFLPNIPGLPALVTMVFTPIMELRTDKERTCYTGALCGLGYNSQTHEVILPEHDIELEFDVKFDVEDIIEVKKMYNEQHTNKRPNFSGLYEKFRIIFSLSNRKTLTVFVSRLFTKSPPREPVTPPFNENRGKWNLVWYSVKAA